MADKYVATSSSRSTGSRAALPGSEEVPGDVVSAARQIREASARVTLSPADARSSHSLRHTPVESWCRVLPWRGVLDRRFCIRRRCLNAIARTMIQFEGGESTRGRRSSSRLIAHGCRVDGDDRDRRPACVQCFREPDGSLPVTTSTRGRRSSSLATARREPLTRATRFFRTGATANGPEGRASGEYPPTGFETRFY